MCVDLTFNDSSALALPGRYAATCTTAVTSEKAGLGKLRDFSVSGSPSKASEKSPVAMSSIATTSTSGKEAKLSRTNSIFEERTVLENISQ